MKKILLIICLLITITVQLFSQTEPTNITFGGERNSSFCKGTGDPNVSLGNQFGKYECTNFTDTVNGKTWKYVPTATPKWRISIDSAGSYMNENVPGIVSLGGASKTPTETYTTLDMGPGLDYRAFNIGRFEGDNLWPNFTSPPAFNNFGLHINSGNYGAVLGSTATSGSRVSMMGVWDESTTGSFFNGPYISSSYKGLSTNYGALGTLTMSSAYRPNNQLWVGSYDENSVFGTGVNFVKIVSTKVPNYSGFGLANGFTHTIRLSRDATGLSKTPYVYSELSNHDVVSPGNVAEGRRFTLHDFGYIPVPVNDSIGFHMLFGEKTNIYQSLAVPNLKVDGTNGRMWAIRQNRVNNNSTPLAFDWIRIDPLDGTQTGDKITLYDKYKLPNAQPSIINGDKSVMVWTGNSTTTVPAFEILPIGLSSLTVENGLEFVGGKIGQGSALVRNTSIPGAGFNYAMTGLNQLNFSTTGANRTTSILANGSGATGIIANNTNVATTDRGVFSVNSDNFSYLGNDNTTNNTTGVLQTFSIGQVDIKATDGVNTRIIRTQPDKISFLNVAASSGGTFTKQLVLDPATFEIRIEDKLSNNGIYGIDNTLDANGHNVTVPTGQYLNFKTTNTAGNNAFAVRSEVNFNSDDSRTFHFLKKSPVDSCGITTFDTGSEIWHSGNATSNLAIKSTGSVDIQGDSTTFQSNAVTIGGTFADFDVKSQFNRAVSFAPKAESAATVNIDGLKSLYTFSNPATKTINLPDIVTGVPGVNQVKKGHILYLSITNGTLISLNRTGGDFIAEDGVNGLASSKAISAASSHLKMLIAIDDGTWMMK